MEGSPDRGKAASGTSKTAVDRREFLKIAGGIAAGVVGEVVLAYALGRSVPPPAAFSTGPASSWETSPGVVDYSLVPETLDGPTPNVLKVAQWYGYWPATFITDFINYMQATYNLKVDVTWDVYLGNDMLFWFLYSGRQYDVIFPSNDLLDVLKTTNRVFNLNLDWIPNVANLNPAFTSVPAEDPFDRRGPNGAFVSLPYFWGTTGIGYRADKIPPDDVLDNGLDLLWMSSFTPSDPSYATVELSKNMWMLGEERDVLGSGFKKAGWDVQAAQGLTPSAAAPPQWSVNETDSSRIDELSRQLLAAKPNLAGFDSSMITTNLVRGTSVLSQAWSGDVIYGIRPDQAGQVPVRFVIPKQGSTWWIDSMAIPTASRNLWLAHQFMNFIHSVDPAWPENQTLTKWNLYSTPNAACYDILEATPYPNGWNMAYDSVLYPNLYDPEGFARCELARDVGASTLLYQYHPVWYSLTGSG